MSYEETGNKEKGKEMAKQLFAVFWIIILSQSCLAMQPETYTAKGTVIDYQGNLVSSATVICYQTDSNLINPSPRSFDTMQTSSDGKFSFQVRKGNYLSGVVAYKSGLALGWKDINIQSELSPVIRLGKPTIFKGIVTDEAGNPIKGADVGILLRNYLMANGIRIDYYIPDPENWYHTKTDNNGQFVFGNIPESSYANFEVKAPGKALICVERDSKLYAEYFAAGRDDIRIVLPKEACIKGQVIDENTGQGLANVEIYAGLYGKNSFQYRNRLTKTDKNGNFEFTQLESRKYQLNIKDNTGGYGYANVDVESGRTIHDVKIMYKKGLPFHVKVYNPDDETCIKDACVSISQKDALSDYDIFSQQVLTDINGIAEFMVPPGESILTVNKLEYGSTMNERYDLIINPEIESKIEIALSHSAYFYSGQTVDERGNPLAGTEIIEKGFGPRVISDANGWFDTKHEHVFTTGSVSRVRVFARHETSGLAVITQLNDPNRTRHPNGKVVLKPAYNITGKVTDPNGKVIPAAYVQLIEGQNCTIIAEVVTDSNGQYNIRSVPYSEDDIDYFLIGYAHGYNHVAGDQISFTDDVTKPIEMHPIELLPEDKIISGIVVDANEKPMPNTMLKIYYPRLLQNYTLLFYPKILTDKQGRFYYKGVSDEPLEISAKPPTEQQQYGTTYARGGDTDIKIILGQTLYYARSLIGKKLPVLKGFGVELNQHSKKVLLCFFDYEQRPSRNCILELNERIQGLNEKGIEVVVIQASTSEQSEIDEWIKENGISIQVGTIQGDLEKVRTNWGIEALPWMILTDKEHIVIAEGFSMNKLDNQIVNSGD